MLDMAKDAERYRQYEAMKAEESELKTTKDVLATGRRQAIASLAGQMAAMQAQQHALAPGVQIDPMDIQYGLAQGMTEDQIKNIYSWSATPRKRNTLFSYLFSK
jgi:hypothetical protein